MSFVFNPHSSQFELINNPIEEPLVFDAICTSSESVGSCVRVVSSMTGVYTVNKVDITDKTKMPAIGIITDKQSAIACTVAYYGYVSSSSTLVIGKPVYINTNAELVFEKQDGLVFNQLMGYSLSENSLFINPSFSEAPLTPLTTLLTISGTLVYIGEGDILVAS